MKIFFVGGGTGGPTAPLLAVARALREAEPKTEFFLVGTRRGVEKELLKTVDFPIAHLSVPAGKWRRYFSLRNFVDVFKVFFGFLKALYLIKKYKPDIIFGAGSYVQVPVAYAAFFSKVPVVAHQQDFQVLLSTKLVAPLAKAITVSFSYSSKNIPESTGLFARRHKSKIFVTGNPVRREVLGGSVKEARAIFTLNEHYPTILVMGGGTGAARLNAKIMEALPELVKYVQVIHQTGGKLSKVSPKVPHYHPYPFLGSELKHAYAVADLVISRGGMSTITELSRLGKVAILVPLPGSAQEDNVALLTMLKFAVGVSEEMFTPDFAVKLVRRILWNHDMQQQMREGIKRLMPRDADKKIARLLMKIYEER